MASVIKAMNKKLTGNEKKKRKVLVEY